MDKHVFLDLEGSLILKKTQPYTTHLDKLAPSHNPDQISAKSLQLLIQNRSGKKEQLEEIAIDGDNE
jgi:hypothetical protein